MGTDDAAINEMDVPIELAFGIRLHLLGCEDLLPQAHPAPVVKSVLTPLIMPHSDWVSLAAGAPVRRTHKMPLMIVRVVVWQDNLYEVFVAAAGG